MTEKKKRKGRKKNRNGQSQRRIKRHGSQKIEFTAKAFSDDNLRFSGLNLKILIPHFKYNFQATHLGTRSQSFFI